MRFNGSDYVHKIDSERLSNQHIRVRELMKDNVWRTLSEISQHTNDPEASVSAQLRHLRKERFGSWVLEKRSRGERSAGLFEYRLMPNGHDSEYVVTERKYIFREALKLVWKHPKCHPDIKKELYEFFKKEK